MNLSFGQQTWGMANVVLNENLWLLGGRVKHNFALTNITEYLNLTGRIFKGPDLGTAQTGACATVIPGTYNGSTLVAVLGGYKATKNESNSSGMKTMQLFECPSRGDLSSCQKFAQNGPDMIYPRYGFGCGSLMTKQGQHILLAMKSQVHSHASLEILDLTKPFDEWKWKEGTFKLSVSSQEYFLNYSAVFQNCCSLMNPA